MSQKTQWLSSYGKYIGAGIVICALIIVSGISLAQKIANGKDTTGVMMTVADIAKEKEAFHVEVFVNVGISYEDMSNRNFESDQLAQLDEVEQQIDDILASRRKNKQEEAAKKALTAVHNTIPVEIGEYDPNKVVAVVPAGNTSVTDPTVPATGPVVPTPRPTAPESTIADPNGKYEYLGEFLLTAYCPCPICCGKWSNMVNPVTASGNPAVAGWSIAAPPRFAFGTKIMIDGHIYSVEDRGSAIQGNHFDVYHNTHEEALKFNMRTTSAYLVVE